jgi:hypothetical protein
MEQASLDIAKATGLDEEGKQRWRERAHVAGIEIEVRCTDNEVLRVRSLQYQKAAWFKCAHGQIDELHEAIDRYVLDEMESRYSRE